MERTSGRKLHICNFESVDGIFAKYVTCEGLALDYFGNLLDWTTKTIFALVSDFGPI